MSFTRQTFRYNNTEMLYTHLIYISPDGNDSTGNGTKDKPYKTIKFATSKLFNDTTAIILLPGVYNENPYINTTHNISISPESQGYNVATGVYITTSRPYGTYRGYTTSMNKGLFMSIDYQANFIGYPNETIVNVQFNEPYCSVVLPGIKKTVNMYGITVNVECNQSMDSIFDSNCLISSLYLGKACNLYNCVLRYICNFDNARGIFHGSYNGSNIYMYNSLIDMGDIYNAFAGNRHSTFMNRSFYEQGYTPTWGSPYKANDANDRLQKNKLIMTNCIILNIQNWLSIKSTTTGPFIDLINCIYPNVNNLYQVTNVNCIKDDIKLDSDYYPLQSSIWKHSGKMDIKNSDNSVSNIGLYGGIYSWYKNLSNKAEITMKNFDIILQRGDDINYEFDIIPPVSPGLIKVNRKINNNFTENGVEYKYPFYKKEWNKINRFEIQ